jgi:hypothetical protein
METRPKQAEKAVQGERLSARAPFGAMQQSDLAGNGTARGGAEEPCPPELASGHESNSLPLRAALESEAGLNGSEGPQGPSLPPVAPCGTSRGSLTCCSSDERHRKHLSRSSLYYRANLERMKEINRRNAASYYREDPQKHRDLTKAKRTLLKEQVRTMLGGACECCCEDEPELLTLDHRNGDGGGAKRKNWFYSYMEVRRAFDSKDAGLIASIRLKFRLLCWSCNMTAKNADGVCAHERNARPKNVSAWAIRMRARFESVKRLMGGRCECCAETGMEFLTIDHRNDDGSQERSKGRGLRDVRTYYMAIERAFKDGDVDEVRRRYALLCHNCNQSRRIGKGLCVHQRSPSPTGTCG